MQTEAAPALSVDDYRRYHREGYLIVPGLLTGEQVDEFRGHTEAVLSGDVALPLARTFGDDGEWRHETRVDHLLRVHQLHREFEIHERFLLNPRTLDVLEALVGPDILALQTMMFLKGPGAAGQGWHQDSYYMTALPDTLIGVWIAIDPVDEENGCLWVAPGSHVEPVYPDDKIAAVYRSDRVLSGVPEVAGASVEDDEANSLSVVASGYRPHVPVVLSPGDAVVFGGHLLHRSYRNASATRMRRAFAAHYCSARSVVLPWDDLVDTPADMANASVILARGETHLPSGPPRWVR